MGAPIGNQNAAKGKRWAAAIERALERKATGSPRPEDVSDLIRGLDIAADEFVSQIFAVKDLGYFKELGDRMDGKSASEVSVEHRKAETLSEEQSRLMAEEYLARARSGLGAGESHRVHGSDAPGLPAGAASPEDSGSP